MKRVSSDITRFIENQANEVDASLEFLGKAELTQFSHRC